MTAWRHFTQGSGVHLQAGGSQLLMTTFPPQLYYLSEGPTWHEQYVPHSLMVIMVIIELYCIIPLCWHLAFIDPFSLYNNCVNLILLSAFHSEEPEAPRKLLSVGKDEIHILEAK